MFRTDADPIRLHRYAGAGPETVEPSLAGPEAAAGSHSLSGMKQVPISASFAAELRSRMRGFGAGGAARLGGEA
jgi:hypothetical protein